jgi:hypothetical protein
MNSHRKGFVLHNTRTGKYYTRKMIMASRGGGRGVPDDIIFYLNYDDASTRQERLNDGRGRYGDWVVKEYNSE